MNPSELGWCKFGVTCYASATNGATAVLSSSKSKAERNTVRVGITNAVISNSGDAAILAGILHSVESTGLVTSVTIFDSNARETASLYPFWNIIQQVTVPASPSRTYSMKTRRRLERLFLELASRVPRLARAVAWSDRIVSTRPSRAFVSIGSCDVIISTGGTYLVDHYDFRPKLLELRIAHALRRPVILWTQSVGPFSTAKSRHRIRTLPRGFVAAYFRDQRSLSSWRAVGQSAQTERVVADAAFALPAQTTRTDPDAVPAQKAIVCVRDWSHRGAGGGEMDRAIYIDSVRSLAVTLIEAGWTVVAMSTCQGLTSYPIDDSVFAAEVFMGIDVEIDVVHRTPVELQRELASANLVVSTRMHLAILALIQRIPTIAIAYEFKTIELFKGMGLEAQVVKIEDISAEWFRDLIASYPDKLKNLSRDELVGLRASAALPADAVARQAHAQ